MVQPRPAQQVLGIVGIGGHVLRRNIQQMLPARRTVGHPSAHARASLHQNNRGVSRRLAKKLRGERRSGKPSADDSDREAGNFPLFGSVHSNPFTALCLSQQ